MNIKNFTPGDVKIYKVELINNLKNTKIDIRPQVDHISIFENIDTPTISCEIIVSDGINLWKNFPIVGEEYIEISFKTPFIEDFVVYNFRVFNITDKKEDPVSNISVYVLNCISEETTKAITIGKINKAFQKSHSDIVVEILNNIVGTNKKIYTEKTKGVVTTIVPNLYPFQAIDFLKQQSISNEVPFSSYKFYENQEGFHFRTLESLMYTKRDNTVGSKIFTYDNAATQSDPAKKAFGYRSIISINRNVVADTFNNIGSGALNNITKSFDIITKQTSSVVTNFKQTADQFIGTDKISTPFNTQGMFNEINSLAKKAKTIFNMKDISERQEFAPENVGRKLSYNQLFNSVVIDIFVHGDSSLTVGDLVELDIIERKGTTDRSEKEQRLSGKFVVCGLRHLIGIGAAPQHRVAMRLQKMGLSI
jgi:hypothetical protein